MSHHSTRPQGGPARKIGFWLGIAAFVFLLVVPVDASNEPASNLAAVALLMAIWWVSDAIPLFATALLPLFLYPLLGILGARETAPI